jgi:hypothetical protein
VPDWSARIAVTLSLLPPLLAGQARLYRIQTERPVALKPWVAHLQGEAGALAAAGRWFTTDPEALAFYANDLDHPVLVTLDVPAPAVTAYRVAAQPWTLDDGSRPRAFSRDPENECFVPAAWLAQVALHPLQASPALQPPSRRRLQP